MLALDYRLFFCKSAKQNKYYIRKTVRERKSERERESVPCIVGKIISNEPHADESKSREKTVKCMLETHTHTHIVTVSQMPATFTRLLSTHKLTHIGRSIVFFVFYAIPHWVAALLCLFV